LLSVVVASISLLIYLKGKFTAVLQFTELKKNRNKWTEGV